MTSANLTYSKRTYDAGGSPDAEAPSEPSNLRTFRIALLIVALPLFAQTFHYIKDLPLLWTVSKAFPVISAPLLLALFWRKIPNDVLFWIISFLWLLLAPSISASFAFDQNFFLGLTAQVKLLGVIHSASFLGFLLILRPSFDELSSAFVTLAVIMALTLFILWALAPVSWYSTGYEYGDAPFLSIDHRGQRIRMPMYFVIIGLLYAFHRALSRLTAFDIFAVCAVLLLTIFVMKTRAVYAAVLVTLAVIMIANIPRAARYAMISIAMICLIIFSQTAFFAELFDNEATAGTNLRVTTVRLVFDFLGQNPLRWLIGVGTISPLDPAAMAQFFNHFFFLSDIGWLGVVFEYGLIGAALLLFLLLRVWWLGHQLSLSIQSPFIKALRDYSLYVIVISPLYSTMTLQPGEIATIAAIFIYGSVIVTEKHTYSDKKEP